MAGKIKPARKANHPRFLRCCWKTVCLWGGKCMMVISSPYGYWIYEVGPSSMNSCRSWVVFFFVNQRSRLMILFVQYSLTVSEGHVVRCMMSSCGCWQWGHLAWMHCFHFFMTLPVGRWPMSHFEMNIQRWCLVAFRSLAKRGQAITSRIVSLLCPHLSLMYVMNAVCPIWSYSAFLNAPPTICLLILTSPKPLEFQWGPWC